MSERGNFRGGRGRGGSGGGDRGGGRGGRGGGQQGQGGEKPKKENILDLTKYMDKEISVKFNGGREGTQHTTLYLKPRTEQHILHSMPGPWSLTAIGVKPLLSAHQVYETAVWLCKDMLQNMVADVYSSPQSPAPSKATINS